MAEQAAQATAEKPNQFALWLRSVELAKTLKTVQGLRDGMMQAGISASSETDPFSGYYRLARERGGVPEPLCAWRPEDDDSTVFVIWGAESYAYRRTDNGWVQTEGPKTPLGRFWPWAAWQPITYEVWDAVTKGAPWPNLDAAVAAQQEANRLGIGGNHPPEAIDEAEDLKTKVEALADVTEYKVIDSDEMAERAQTRRAKLLEHARACGEKHAVEKAPSLAEGRRVDGRWLPTKKTAEECAEVIRGGIKAWENKKLRDKQEKERLAREAHDKAVREAEVKARADREAHERAVAEAAAKNAPPPPPPAPPMVPEMPVAPPSQPIGRTAIKGAMGRAASVSKPKTVLDESAPIDWPAVSAFFQNHEDLQTFLKQKIKRALGAGATVPGITTKEEVNVT